MREKRNPGEATAVWQWSNFLHHQIEADHSTVVLNLDETNVKLFQERGGGHVTLKAQALKKRPQSLSCNVARGVTRASMTHIAIICDDPGLQKYLPQVILVSQTQVSAAAHSQLQQGLPDNVLVWRRKNAWVNASIMKEFATLLGQRLRAHRLSRRFILSFDAFKAHLSAPVLRAFSNEGFWPLVIPAKLTWALQPCDTHLFAMYKDKLATEYQLRLTDIDGPQAASWTILVHSVVTVIKEVMEANNWRKAFADTGLTKDSRLVSQRVLQKLEFDTRPAPPTDGFPTLRQLQAVFPVRSEIPISELFLALAKRARATDVRVLAHPDPIVSLSPPRAAPWFGRTRSTSALARPLLSDTAAPAPLAPCPPPPLPSPLAVPASPPQMPMPPFLASAKRLSRGSSSVGLPQPQIMKS